MIAQCLRWSHYDALAGMDAQRIEVLHITYRDAIVIAVAHHFVFDFLPSFQRFFNQDLRRKGEGLFSQTIQLFVVRTETRTQSTKGICSSYDDWITNLANHLQSLLSTVYSHTSCSLHINATHHVSKPFTVFCIDDCFYRGTYNRHSVFLEHTLLSKLHTAVQRCLSTECQHDAFWAFFLNDTLHEFWRDGQVIDMVGNFFRGLYSCDVRIDQYGTYTLFLQCFQSLRA